LKILPHQAGEITREAVLALQKTSTKRWRKLCTKPNRAVTVLQRFDAFETTAVPNR
jgi:hypothetical protein